MRAFIATIVKFHLKITGFFALDISVQCLSEFFDTFLFYLYHFFFLEHIVFRSDDFFFFKREFDAESISSWLIEQFRCFFFDELSVKMSCFQPLLKVFKKTFNRHLFHLSISILFLCVKTCH